MINKSVNRLLIMGVGLITLGLILLIYSITTFAEVRALYDKINFDDLDNNNQMSTADKYYKHLNIADFLNMKLNRNKNLPIKNVSCTYLDYAHHNTVSLYKLIYNGDRSDVSRREITEANVKNLNDILGAYAGCKRAAQYKQELTQILEDIKKSNDLHNSSSVALDSFLRGSGNIERAQTYEQEQQSPQAEGEILYQNSYSGEDEEYLQQYAPLQDNQ